MYGTVHGTWGVKIQKKSTTLGSATRQDKRHSAAAVIRSWCTDQAVNSAHAMHSMSAYMAARSAAFSARRLRSVTSMLITPTEATPQPSAATMMSCMLDEVWGTDSCDEKLVDMSTSSFASRRHEQPVPVPVGLAVEVDLEVDVDLVEVEVEVDLVEVEVEVDLVEVEVEVDLEVDVELEVVVVVPYLG